jgi:hypothetical protein
MASIASGLGALKRWLYRGGRPHLLARAMNRLSALLHASGIAPNYLVTLEVRGRVSGRPISFPLVMVVVASERYLVSMLGTQAAWVRNLHAADGFAVLRHGSIEHVRLAEIPSGDRPPILKAYLHAIAAQFPVFRVTRID